MVRVRSPFVSAVVAHARRLGIDPGRVGRESVDMSRAGARGVAATPLEAERLAEEVAAALGDPTLGVHVAEAMPEGCFGVVEYAAQRSANLRGALAQIVRYNRLMMPEARFSLEPGQGGACFTHRIPGTLRALGHHANEFTLGIVVVRARRLTLTNWAPRRVWFAHAAPPDPGPVQRFFGTTDICFDAGENAMLIDDEALDTPLTSADVGLCQVLEDFARKLVAAEPCGDDLESSVRAKIRASLGEGNLPTADAVAVALRMSPRTLQRRAAEAGTSFAALLDSERSTLARRHVAEANLSLGEIAYLLGYSDLRAFTRAFRRWTGRAPSSYRGASGISP